MNKIYKLVWSNIKNCYVVTSELAKNHKKSPKSNVFNKTLVAGVLSCVFSCGFANSSYAYTVIGSGVAGIQLDEFHSNIVSSTLNENARKEINAVSHNGQVLVLNDSYYGGTLSNDAKAVQTALKDLIVSGTGVAPKDLTDPYFVVEAVLDDTLQASYLVHYIGSNDNTQYIKLTTAEAETIGLRKFLSTPWVTENGNYITKDKDVVQNLQALDAKTADLDTIVAGHTTDIAGLKDLSNITSAGESVVRNLAQSAVKVVNGTNTTVTEGTDGTYKTYAVNVAGNGTITDGNTGLVTGDTVYDAIQSALSNVGSGGSYSAGDGLTLDTTNNKFSVKAGTNVTVNNNGVSVIGNGSVASGNTGLINGGTLYNEVRPSSDGTNVSRGNTVGQNLLSLDSKVVTLSDKVYNRCFGINSTMGSLDFAYSVIDEMRYLSGDNGTWSEELNAYNTKYSNKGGIGAAADQTIAIGHLNIAEGAGSIVIGNDTASMVNKKKDGTLVTGYVLGNSLGNKGVDKYGRFDGSTIDGNMISTGLRNIVIGNDAFSRTTDSIAIGNGAYNQTYYGSDDNGETRYRTYGQGSVALGAQTNTFASYATAIGSYASSDYKGIAIGNSTHAHDGSISIGYSVMPRNLKSVDEVDLSNSMITIGYEAETIIGRQHYTGYSPIAIGHKAYADESLAIGKEAKSSNKGIAIGENAYAYNRTNAEEPTSIYNPEPSIAIGNNARDYVGGMKGGNVLLGHNSSTQNGPYNAVAIGNNSVADSSYTVSVGNSNLKRKITNVANGYNLSDAATIGQVSRVASGDSHIRVNTDFPQTGIKTSSVSVITTDYIREGDIHLASSDTINTAIQRNSTLVAGSGINIQKNYSDAGYQTIAEIIAPYETGSERAEALLAVLNNVEALTGQKPNEQIGVTQDIYNRLINCINEEVTAPYLTQSRYDSLVQTSIMTEPPELESKTISLNIDANGSITKNNQDLIVGGVVYDEVRPANGRYVRTANTVAQNLASIDSSMVGYDNSSHSLLTLDGSSGTKVTNLKPATLSATSTDAVIGAQLYATNQNIAGFSADITRNKNNIRDLNTSVSAALSSVSSTSALVDTLDNTKADISLNNLSNAGRQVISNAAINAVQEYMATQQGNTEPATPSAPMMYNSNSNALTVTNAGNGSLHVGEGSYVNGTSSIAIGVGNQVNANNAGAFGDPSIINADASYVLGNDDTVNTGAIGSFIVGNDSVSNATGTLLFGSNSKSEISAENSMGLGNNTTVSAKNSVALGSNSIADEENVISIGNTNLQRRIINVANGNIAENSTDAVTGSQLFAINQTVSQHSDLIAQNTFNISHNANEIEKNKLAIATKADIDASNINVDDWSQKLGVGQIEEGNTGLVTGGTVYDSVKTFLGNNPVQANDEAVFIGANHNGNIISIHNKDGENRIITGVATNPEDLTSATNVGYVNTIASNILENVNGRFAETDKRMNKVGANAAALASLTPASFEGDEKWSLAASVGHYKGETAGAVGAFYKPTENVMMNVRGAVGNGENMLGAGVAVSLTKGDIPGVTKRQLANTVNRQAEAIGTLQQNQVQYQQRIAQQDEQIAVQNQRIANQEKQIQELISRLDAIEKY